MSRACFICARESFAHLTYKNKTVCGACAPHAYAGEIYMARTDLEAEAIERGGQAAGGYLDSINKFDLSVLADSEWTAFLGKFLDGYSDHMRASAAVEPPF